MGRGEELKKVVLEVVGDETMSKEAGD